MGFVELADHINCTHAGTFSPVLFRFEGGDNHSGFLVEEYKSAQPYVKLYGDVENARLVFLTSLKTLPSLLNLALIGDFADQVQSRTLVWYNFDVRLSIFRVAIYCSPQGITITSWSRSLCSISTYCRNI